MNSGTGGTMAFKSPPPPPLMLKVVKRSPNGQVLGKGQKSPIGSRGRLPKSKPYSDNLPSKGGPLCPLDLPAPRQVFLELIEKGATPASAAKVSGIGHNNYMSLIMKDPELREAVETAREKSKLELLQKIHNHPDWKASAWKLAALWPEEFGKKNLTEAEAREIILRCKQLAQTAMEHVHLPPHQIETILRKMDDLMYPTQVTEVVIKFDEPSTPTLEPVTAQFLPQENPVNGIPLEKTITAARKRKHRVTK